MRWPTLIESKTAVGFSIFLMLLASVICDFFGEHWGKVTGFAVFGVLLVPSYMMAYMDREIDKRDQS